MKRNRLLFIILGVLVVIFGVVLIFLLKEGNNNIEPGDRLEDNEAVYNFHEGVISDKEVNGITFTSITCEWDGVNSNLFYTITNINDEVVNLGDYVIEVYDINNELLDSFNVSLDYDLEIGVEYREVISTAVNLSEVYSIEFKLSDN